MAIAPITVGDTGARVKMNAAIEKANEVDGKASLDQLAAEAASRGGTDEILQGAIVAEEAARQEAVSNEAALRQAADVAEFNGRQAAIAAERAARQAAILAMPAPIPAPLQHRPGDAPIDYGQSLADGDPSGIPSYPSALRQSGENGSAVRLTGAGVLAPRHLYAVEPNRRYLVTFAVQRRVDSWDPDNDAIRCALAWYGQGKGRLAGVLAQTVVHDFLGLTTGAGRQVVTATVSRSSGVGIDLVAPTGARYVRPYAEMYGTTVQNDVEIIGWQDITDAVTYAPDVSALEARIAAQEGLDVGDRLENLEAQVVAPNGYRLKVVGDIAAATIPDSTDTIEVLGFYTAGLGGDHHRVRGLSSVPGAVQSADGDWWAPGNSGRLTVRDFGAKGDGVTDDGPAFNRYAAYLKLKGGGSFLVLPGRYRIETPVLIDVSDNSDEVLGRGIPLIGAGMACCTIVCATGTNFAVEIRATATEVGNSSYNSHQQVSGIKFVSSGINVGNGLLMNATAICDLSGVAAIGLDVGVKTLDVHTMNFYDCHLRYNKIGHFGVAQVNLSSPNAFSYYGCNINGNVDWGIITVNASVMNFFGGTVEFNGLASSLGQSGGMRFGASGRNGTIACSMYGVWFEANAGVADVWCDHGESYASYNFDGCIFNRTNNLAVIGGVTYNYYVTNNILLTTLGAASRLNVKNCAFKGWNDYPASAARPYINIAASNCVFSESGNHYDNPIEAPTAASDRLLARGRLVGASGAIIRSWNIATATRLGTGQYKVTFVAPGLGSTGRMILGTTDMHASVRFDAEDATSVTFSVVGNSGPSEGQFVDPGTVMFTIYE